MNWDIVSECWRQARGKVRERWGRLTDKDLDAIAGNRELFISEIQRRYGISREEAERQADEFAREYERPRAAGSA